MKKVLIIGTVWPYHHGGARIPGLAKYLPEFGWEPVVLTMPLPGDAEVGYRTEEVRQRGLLYSLVNRVAPGGSEGSREDRAAENLGLSRTNPFTGFIFSCIRDIVTYRDRNLGWEKAVVRKAEELIRNEDIKVLMSTSPPMVVNIITAKLKKKYKLAWMADFPHLWSQNNSYPYSETRRFFDRRLELKTLKDVDMLFTTAQPLAEKLRSLHRDKEVRVILHGFDPESENTLPDKVTDNFTITYTGSLAPEKREPGMLFEALRKLFDEGRIDRNSTEVRFYGPKADWVENEIKKYGLEYVAVQYGRVPMPEALAHQRESQLLFNPKWNDPTEKGIHSMKILEYFAARRPILATGIYRDIVDDMLEETKAGICVTSVEETMGAIEQAYREYRETGTVAWHGDVNETAKYGHRDMAKQFAELFDEIV